MFEGVLWKQKCNITFFSLCHSELCDNWKSAKTKISVWASHFATSDATIISIVLILKEKIPCVQ